MKPFINYILALCLFWSTPIFADQKGTLLRVGAPEYYPLSFQGDGDKAKGFFVEYLQYLGDREEWELTFEFGGREELLNRLEKGQLDLVLSVDYKPEFKERFTLTHERIVADWGQIVLREGLNLDSILDLEGKVIAVNKEGPFYTEIYQFSDSLNHKPSIRYADSYEEILELVKSKEVDAGLITRVFAQSQRKPLAAERNAVSLSPTGVGFAFTKGKFEAIRKEIDEHLQEDKVDPDSIYQVLYKKWFPKRKAPLNPQVVMYIVGGLAFLILFFVLTSVTLRRQVEHRTKKLKEENKERLKAEWALKTAKDDLEIRVEKRTQELTYANEKLTDEMSARWEAQISLKQALTELEVILENAPLGFMLTKGRTVYRCNREIENIFSTTRDHIIGTDGILPFLHPEDQKVYEEQISASNLGEDLFESEAQLEQVGVDHENIWARIIKAPINNTEGLNLWIIEDISMRKKAFQSMINSENKFRNMFNHHGAMMILEDPETRKIVEANPSAVEFIGETDGEQLIGSQLEDFVAENAGPLSKRWEITNEMGQNFRCKNFSLKNSTSEIRVLECRSVSFLYGDKMMIFSILFNITKRHLFEKELIALNQKLEGVVKIEVDARLEQEKLLIQQSKMAAMGEMLSMIAHQWRQPLSTVSTLSGNMKIQIELENYDMDDFSKSLDEINDHAQFLSTTINDFRNFFNPNKKEQRVNINKMLTQVCNMVGKSYESHAIDLVKVFDFKEEIVSFSTEIMQVCLNILMNAQDVLEERKVDNPRVTIASIEEESRVTIEVFDNGGGIEDHVLPKVFEPYFTTKHSTRGTGLGLYMSKTIIEKHCQGKLEVKNRDGGAVFSIHLPKKIDTQELQNV